jgi:selT/selW/selH-like putative selenoprotein
LAAKITEVTGAEPELCRGAGGIFDVTRDDDLLFSKHKEGRFPEESEILALLR